MSTMKKISLFTITLLCITLLSTNLAYAADNTEDENKSKISEFIEKTIDSDNDILGKLCPILQKAYEKVVSAFKKVGTLSKDVSRVVKMYNALDEDSETYADDLVKFFEEYNKLGPVKRKLVDFCTGVLSAKDKLIATVQNTTTIDLYSTKYIKSTLTGNLTYKVNDESVINVDKDGKITTVGGIGYSKVTISNGEDEITYRVFVKKPILATKATVKVKKTININIPTEYTITKVQTSNNAIKLDRNGYELTVKGLSKGTSYIYVGTTDGKTLKYKITIKK